MTRAPRSRRPRRAPRSRARRLVALLGALGTATTTARCAGPPAPPPRAQALLYIDTDAPAPRMVDRLRITVLDAALAPACAACTREVPLDDPRTTWPISLGVEPRADGGPVFVRVTLFGAGRESLGVPTRATAVDTIAQVRFGDGVLEQDVFLPFDCVGVAPDTAVRTACRDGATRESAPIAPTDPHTARPPGRVNGWHGEYARRCRGAPSAGTGHHDEQVCIAGGVFWLGDYRVRPHATVTDPVPERPVALSPFFLDRYEYTVARYRAALAAGFPPPGAGELGVQARSGYCTYADTGNDALPLNCVTPQLAERLCEWEHRALPSEAQWEWAAGSREHEWFFPWGDALPDCEMLAGSPIVPARPGASCETAACFASSTCRPEPVGTRGADATIDGVMDLTGNVSEWTADAFAGYGDPCWDIGSYGPDPVCTREGGEDPSQHGYRGASLDDFRPPSLPSTASGALLRQVVRDDYGRPAQFTRYYIGFRCARADGDGDGDGG